MTKDELSRWIAEKMEPVALATGQTDWWQYQRHNEDTRRPRPYDDPEIAMRLLNHDGFVSLNFLEPGVYEAIFCGEDVHTDQCGDKMATSQSTAPERAIAEAFALANGWPE